MQLEVGSVVDGKVTGITKFGAFVSLGDNQTGMVHISEIASTYVKEIRDYITENQTVRVKVIGIDERGKISLSMKKVADAPAPKRIRPDEVDFKPKRAAAPATFEDMLNKYKQDSEDKFSDLKRSSDGKRGTSGRGRGGRSS